MTGENEKKYEKPGLNTLGDAKGELTVTDLEQVSGGSDCASGDSAWSLDVCKSGNTAEACKDGNSTIEWCCNGENAGSSTCETGARASLCVSGGNQSSGGGPW